MDPAAQQPESAQLEPFPIQQSNLYTAWLIEREQVLKHKWVLSERAGFDVGYHAARWDWDIHHRGAWISGMRDRGLWPG